MPPSSNRRSRSLRRDKDRRSRSTRPRRPATPEWCKSVSPQPRMHSPNTTEVTAPRAPEPRTRSPRHIVRTPNTQHSTKSTPKPDTVHRRRHSRSTSHNQRSECTTPKQHRDKHDNRTSTASSSHHYQPHRSRSARRPQLPVESQHSSHKQHHNQDSTNSRKYERFDSKHRSRSNHHHRSKQRSKSNHHDRKPWGPIASQTPKHHQRNERSRSRHNSGSTPPPDRYYAAAPAPPSVPGFVSDKHHYDIGEVAHLNFPKKIKATDHSITAGTAKRDPHDIFLWELLYNKNANWGLRYLAHGRFAGVEITKSFKESVFVQELLRSIRGYKMPGGLEGPTPIDIDSIATEIARIQDLPFKTGHDKKHIYGIIARQTYDFLATKTPGSVTNDMQKRLRELEIENANLKAHTKPILSALGAVPTAHNQQAPPQHIDINRNDRDKILATTAPATQTPKDVDNWIKQLKLSNQQTKQVAKLTTDIQAQLSSMEEPVAQEHVRAVLCDWGLSITLAAKLKNHAMLVKILAHTLAKAQ